MNDRQNFIEENLNLVYFLIQKHYPTFIRDNDIIQCGMLGLCKAAERWDSRKSKFSTYATKWVLNEIRRELKNRGKHSSEISLESLMEDKRDEY